MIISVNPSDCTAPNAGGEVGEHQVQQVGASGWSRDVLAQAIRAAYLFQLAALWCVLTRELQPFDVVTV